MNLNDSAATCRRNGLLCIAALGIGAMAAPLAAQRNVIERASTATHGLALVREAYWDRTRNVMILRDGAAIRQYDGAGRIATEPDGGAEAVTCPFPGSPRDRFEWDATLGARRYADGLWTSIPQLFEPPRGAGSICHMVLDTARQRAVLAVDRWGSGNPSYWEFDGTSWTTLGNTPGVATCVAFDAGRGRTVVLDRTFRHWEWDGLRWHDLGPTYQSGVQRIFGMCFDTRRNRLVLFGDNGLFATFVAEYTGTQWVGVAQPNELFDRATLAYDEGRAATYVFAQRYGGGAEVWTWDGATFAQRVAPTTRPSPRNDAMLTTPGTGKFNPYRCLLFGGRDQNGVPNDETWLWDGTTWAQQSLAFRPSPRSAGAMAQGASANAVLFGGLSASGTALGDTWSYDTTIGWQVIVTTPVQARLNHAMAFDGQTTWMFGGTDGPTKYGDLRYLDTSSFPGRWRLVNTTGGPQPRHTHAMAFDSVRRRLVVFGGLDANDFALDDTWEYDLQSGTWQNVVSAVRPSARVNHALVFDPQTRHCVLLGGYEWNTGAFLSEIWEWNGTIWNRRPPETSTLVPIENLAACWYEHGIVAFGGQPGFAVPPSGRHYEVNAHTTHAALGQNFPFELQVTGSPSQSVALVTTPLRLRLPGHGGVVLLSLGASNQPLAQLGPPLVCVPQTLYVDPLVTLPLAQDTEYTLDVPIGFVGYPLWLQGLTLSPAGCYSFTTAWRTVIRWLPE